MIGSEKLSFEALKEKLSRLEIENGALRDSHERIEAVRRETFENSLQMEQAIERANQMAAEAEIANLEFSQILNTVTDAICVINRQQHILRTNHAFSEMIQKKEQEVVGRKCSEILKSSICDSDRCPMKEAIRTRKSIEMDMELTTGSGQLTPFLLTVTPFYGFEGKPIGILSIFKNITERKKMEAALHKANAELEKLTIMDGLTQIANRRHFDQTLQNEWKRMSREGKFLSLIMCDVDYFKPFNDQNGHQKGDDCLREVAAAIRENVKRSFDLVARYGGEEFAVILPDTDASGAMNVAEKIRRGVESLKIPHPGSQVCEYVTISLGISAISLPDPNMSIESLINKADMALYQAKEKGRNQWVLETVPE